MKKYSYWTSSQSIKPVLMLVYLSVHHIKMYFKAFRLHPRLLSVLHWRCNIKVWPHLFKGHAMLQTFKSALGGQFRCCLNLLLTPCLMTTLHSLVWKCSFKKTNTYIYCSASVCLDGSKFDLLDPFLLHSYRQTHRLPVNTVPGLAHPASPSNLSWSSVNPATNKKTKEKILRNHLLAVWTE